MLLALRLEPRNLEDAVIIYSALLSISIPMDRPNILLKLGQLYLEVSGT